MGCGAEAEANTIMNTLVAGEEFPIRQPDLDDSDYQIPIGGPLVSAITKLTNADLTTKTVDGTGAFDILMSSVAAHLKGEYEKNRITGADYTKAYIELASAAMGNAVQYLLGKEQAYWQAVTAQQQAKIGEIGVVTARVALETAKVEMAKQQFDATNSKATYALTKMKLSSEGVAYCLAKYNLDNMLPAQLGLVQEQKEAQRAQTLDTRSDGITPVSGSVGKQKQLYTQQITSYQRDAENKAARLFTDAWMTMKTMDEGLLPPLNFANSSLDEVLGVIKSANGFSS